MMTHESRIHDVDKLPVEVDETHKAESFTDLFTFIKTNYIDTIKDYYDSVLCIFEVEKPFPIGFYF